MAIYLTIYVKLGLKRYGRFLSGISSPQLGHHCMVEKSPALQRKLLLITLL